MNSRRAGSGWLRERRNIAGSRVVERLSLGQESLCPHEAASPPRDEKGSLSEARGRALVDSERTSRQKDTNLVLPDSRRVGARGAPFTTILGADVGALARGSPAGRGQALLINGHCLILSGFVATIWWRGNASYRRPWLPVESRSRPADAPSTAASVLAQRGWLRRRWPVPRYRLPRCGCAPGP